MMGYYEELVSVLRRLAESQDGCDWQFAVQHAMTEAANSIEGLVKEMAALREIAMKLLDKYKDTETGMIWEYSGNINKSLAHLDKTCDEYKRRIMGAE